MLTHLAISNFAIVPSLELEFGDGFTAITGETGAGKSILVDALGLLLGDRSDAGWVRPGAKRAQLTAAFDVTGNEAARALLEEADLAEDGECLLRRVIAAGGRSRAYVNGTPVTVAQLQALGAHLVEIHGQNEHLSLARRDEQFRLLDGCGEHGDRAAAVAEAFGAWRELRRRLDALDEEAPASESDLDYLRFQLRELEDAAIPEAEHTELEKEHQRLAQGGSLLADMDHVLAVLEHDEEGVSSRLARLHARLSRWAELDDDIRAAADLLGEAQINTTEALGSLRHAADRIDLDPRRLAEVEDRLATLHDLGRKHGVPPGRLTATRDGLAERLARLENRGEARERLVAGLEAAEKRYRAAAEKLGEARAATAEKLSSEVTALMAELGMPGGTFVIDVHREPERQPSARGDDRLEWRVSANPGMPPGALGRVASGGELSRISLAIRVATSRSRGTRTQIFDEIDAGIGGETANAVGRLLQRLARDMQVLCVTHLAQVAACANQHRQVRKHAGDASTHVDILALDEGERIDEIARMLGGRVSEQSRAHAAELLRGAGGD